MESLFILFILLLILAYHRKESEGFPSILDKSMNLSFRGGLALLIVFHHISKVFEFPLSSQGGIYGETVVGLFFFFSGYGLMMQYMKRGETYLNGLLLNRAKKLLPSFLIIAAIGVLLTYATGCDLLEMGGGKIGYIIVPNSWYVYVQFYLYASFVIVGHCVKNKRQMVLGLLVCTIVWVVICEGIGLGNWWWRSCFAFNTGIVYTLIEQKKELHEKIANYTIPIVLICMIVAIAIHSIRLRMPFVILLTTILPIGLTIISERVKMPKNWFLQLFGRVSYEIYLTHGLIISLINKKYSDLNVGISIILVIVLSIILSLFISEINRKIQNININNGK